MLVMTTTIRLRGPADIISVLPYHLGYRPTDSILLVCQRASRLVMVARMDLPPPHVDPEVILDELLPPVLREHPDLVSIVCFEDDAATFGRSEATSTLVRDELAHSGVTVANRLLVRAGRWWSLDSDLPRCPDEGLPLPVQEEVPAIAQYIVMGRDPARDRASLVERVSGRGSARDPLEDTRCAALIRHLDETRRTRRMVGRFRRDALRHWGRVLGDPPAAQTSPEAWSWACVSLLDVTVRDLLIAWLCPGTLDLEVFSPGLLRQAEQYLPLRPHGHGDQHGDLPDDRHVDLPGEKHVDLPDDRHVDLPDDQAGDDLDHDAVVARLSQLCWLAPRELAAGPLTVLAQVAWWHGDGTLARIAVEQALVADPAYRLALLLEPMIDLAMRPERTA